MAINLDHVTEQITVTDTAANADLTYVTKGTGSHNLNTGNGTAFRVSDLSGTIVAGLGVFAGSSSQNSVYLVPYGSAGTANTVLASKGAGSVFFATNTNNNSAATNQAAVTHTASAVNYVQATGAVTGGNPVISAQGSDTNVGLAFLNKGTSAFGFRNDATAGALGLELADNTTVDKTVYIDFHSSASTDFDYRLSRNPGVNGNAVYQIAGTGSHVFYTGTTANQLTAVHTASAVNWVQVSGAATGGNPYVSAQGSDTNVSLTLSTKGTGGFQLAANGNSVFTGNGGTHFRVRTDLASATGFWEVFGTTGGPIFRSTATTGLIQTSGGQLSLQTDTSGTTQLAVAHTASAVNYVQVNGATTGNRPTISAQGSDANVALALSAKAGGNMFFTASSFFDFTLSGGTQFRTTNTASAVNYVQVNGAATGDRPLVSVQGSDANINMGVLAKGSGAVYLQSGSGAALEATATGSANYFAMVGTAAGIAPVLSVKGSDTNISQVVQSKGTGAINLASGISGLNLSNGTTVTAITNTATGSYTSIPSVAVSAPTTAGGVQATASVSTMTPTGVIAIVAGGTGYTAGDVLTVSGGTLTSGTTQITVSTVSAGVITAATVSSFGVYSALPANPASVTGGTGSGATFTVNYRLFAALTITNAGSGYVEQPLVTFSGGGGSGAAAYATVGSNVNVRSLGGGFQFYTTSGVSGHPSFVVGGASAGTTSNYLLTLAGGPGGGVFVGANGIDTNINTVWYSKGSGTQYFASGGGGTNQFQITHTASAVNFVQVTGSVTGASPIISTQGSDAVVSLVLRTKGTGSNIVPQFDGGMYFQNLSSRNQFVVLNTASAENYIQVTGSTLSNGPTISAQGAAGSVDLKLASKGYGGLLFYANATDLQFSIGLTFSPVNFFRVTGSTAGVGLVLTAQGSDTNIPVAIQPKGTGALQAQLTDSTATGGNARGANAIDFQTSRNAASQVASGSNSVVGGGSRNTASGSLTSVVGGFSNSATGYAATIVGGISHTAAGYYNFIGGGFTNSGTSSTVVTSQNGTLTSGSQFVTLTGSNASIKVGQYITGALVDTDTYVLSISGTGLLLSKPALAAGNVVLSFFTPHGVVVGGGNNTATGSYSFIGGGGDAGDAANRNVASGDWSFVGGGKTNTSSGILSTIAGGWSNTASGQNSFIGSGFGNVASGFSSSIVGGNSNISNSTYSYSSGFYATTRGIGGYHAFGANVAPIANANGVSQSGLLVLGVQTTDATATVLRSDTAAAGTTNQVILPNNSAYFFTGEVVAGKTAGGDTKGWTIEGVIKRGANAASTALVGTPTVTSTYADAGASTWVIAVTADTTNGGLAVTFTGQAATTIRTVAKISTVEMTF